MRSVIGRVSMAAAVMAAAFLAFPADMSAQSLGEAAERAKKERKGKSKVITETDLRRAGGGAQEPPVSSAETTEAPAPAAAEGTAAAAPAKEKTEEELRAEAEAKWRERLQKAQGDVTRLSAEATQLQTALNDISQNLYGATRTNMMTRLDQVRRDLATAQQSVSDIEEEGRRERYRP